MAANVSPHIFLPNRHCLCSGISLSIDIWRVKVYLTQNIIIIIIILQLKDMSIGPQEGLV